MKYRTIDNIKPLKLSVAACHFYDNPIPCLSERNDKNSREKLCQQTSFLVLVGVTKILDYFTSS